VRLGDDRQVVIEIAGRDPVEVVPVVVGQDYEVERRQLADGQRGSVSRLVVRPRPA
jgi:hypothetical protein